jgi:hypothetical protein
MSFTYSFSYLCTPECRPTVEEVITEVLAYSTARIQISNDPDLPKPSAPSKKLEQDDVASLIQATSHVCALYLQVVMRMSNHLLTA